jgi:hypothetical protein
VGQAESREETKVAKYRSMIMHNQTIPITRGIRWDILPMERYPSLDLARASKGFCVFFNEFSVKQNLALMQVETSRRTLDHSVQGMYLQ